MLTKALNKNIRERTALWNSGKCRRWVEVEKDCVIYASMKGKTSNIQDNFWIWFFDQKIQSRLFLMRQKHSRLFHT